MTEMTIYVLAAVELQVTRLSDDAGRQPWGNASALIDLWLGVLSRKPDRERVSPEDHFEGFLPTASSEICHSAELKAEIFIPSLYVPECTDGEVRILFNLEKVGHSP
jgi:hypothetical protein